MKAAPTFIWGTQEHFDPVQTSPGPHTGACLYLGLIFNAPERTQGMEAKIITVASSETGYVVDTKDGTRHHLSGPGAPKDAKVGDKGTLRYVSTSSRGFWAWEPIKG